MMLPTDIESDMYKSDTTDSESENNAPPPRRRKILSKRRQKMSPLKEKITQLKSDDMETDTSFEARLTPLLSAPTIPQLTDKLLSSPSENVGVKILRPVPDTENKERLYRYGVGFSLTRTLYDPKKETLGWLLKTLNRQVSYSISDINDIFECFLYQLEIEDFENITSEDLREVCIKYVEENYDSVEEIVKDNLNSRRITLKEYIDFMVKLQTNGYEVTLKILGTILNVNTVVLFYDALWKSANIDLEDFDVVLVMFKGGKFTSAALNSQLRLKVKLSDQALKTFQVCAKEKAERNNSTLSIINADVSSTDSEHDVSSSENSDCVSVNRLEEVSPCNWQDFPVEICSQLTVRNSNNEMCRNDVIRVELMIHRNAFEPTNYDSDQIFYCVRPQINVHKPGRSYSAHHMRQHLLDFAMTMDQDTRRTVDMILNTRGMSYSYYRDRMACKGTCGFETTLYLLSQMFHVDICVIRSDFVWVSSDVHPSHCPVILIQLNNGRFCGTKPSRPFDVGTVPLIHVPKLGVKKFVQTSTPGRWQQSSELKSALQRAEMSPIFASPSTSVEPASTESSSKQSTQGSTSSISDILSGNSLSTEYKSMANSFLKGDTVNVSQNVTDDSCKVTSENSDLESTIINMDSEGNCFDQSRNTREEDIVTHDEDRVKNIKHGQGESAISADATFSVDDVNNKFVSHDHSYSKSRSQDEEQENSEKKEFAENVGDDDTTITCSQESSDENSEEEKKDAELGEKYMFDQLSERLETTLTVENSSDETERSNPVSDVNKFSLVTDGNVTKVIVWPDNTLVATRLGERQGKVQSYINKTTDETKRIEDTIDVERKADLVQNEECDGGTEGEKSEFCDESIIPKNDAEQCVGTEENITAETDGKSCATQNATGLEKNELKDDHQCTSSIMDNGEKKNQIDDEVTPDKSVTRYVSVPIEDISLEVPITGPNDSFIIHGDNEKTSVVMFACRKCPEIFYSLTAYNQHLFRKHRITYVSRYPAKMIERLVSPKKTEQSHSKKCEAQARNSDVKVDEEENITLKIINESIGNKNGDSENNEDEEKEDVVISKTLDGEPNDVSKKAESMSDINNPEVEMSTVTAEYDEFNQVEKITFTEVETPKASPNARKPKSLWISQHSGEILPTEVNKPNDKVITSTENKKTKTLGYVRRSKRPRKSTQTSNATETEKIREILDGDEVQEVEEEDGESEMYMNVKLPRDELKRYKRKFACNYCETKTFTEQGYLLHVRNEHKINYQCFNCLKPFHFEDSFQRHRKICMEGQIHLEEIFDTDDKLIPINVSKNSDATPKPGQSQKKNKDKKTSPAPITESKKTSTPREQGQGKKAKLQLEVNAQKQDIASSQCSPRRSKRKCAGKEDTDEESVTRSRKRKREEPSGKKRLREGNSTEESNGGKSGKKTEKLGDDSFKKLLQEYDLMMRPMKTSKKLKEKEKKVKEMQEDTESSVRKLRSKEIITSDQSSPKANTIGKKSDKSKKTTVSSNKAKKNEKLISQIKQERRSTRSTSKNSDKSIDIDFEPDHQTSPISDLTVQSTNIQVRQTRSKSKNSDKSTENEVPNSQEPIVNEPEAKKPKKRKPERSTVEDTLKGNKSAKKFATKKPTNKKKSDKQMKEEIENADETLSADDAESEHKTTDNSSDEDDAKFYCQVCDGTFSDHAEFKKHKEKCTKIPKKYVCPECKQTFAQKCLRDQHYRWTHTDLPPEFVCKICDKAYPYKKTLEEHNIRKHSDEFKFLCDICTRGFNHLGEFNQHRASHTGLKEFKCGKCNIKSFSSVGKLNYHLKHCGKPNQYECSVCGKKFSSPRGIAEHVTNEHNDKTERKIYQCPICPGATYTSHGGYCRHLREKHQVGRKGQTLDAAVVESFFANMQKKPKK